MNWLYWDERQQRHVPFNPDLFRHLFRVSPTRWISGYVFTIGIGNMILAFYVMWYGW